MQRRKFELLMKDLWRLLSARRGNDGEESLDTTAWDIRRFTGEMAADVSKLRCLLEFTQALRASDAPGRQVAEREIMGLLAHMARASAGQLAEGGLARSARFPGPHEVAPEWRPALLVLGELRAFAHGCFAFKRPRDAFGGWRRALAFEILGGVAGCVDLPDALRKARQALKKSRSVESREAAAFLEHYYEVREAQPDEEIIEELLNLAERTDSRSTAAQALNALVETNTISELEALDRMAVWKDQRRWPSRPQHCQSPV